MNKSFSPRLVVIEDFNKCLAFLIKLALVSSPFFFCLCNECTESSFLTVQSFVGCVLLLFETILKALRPFFLRFTKLRTSVFLFFVKLLTNFCDGCFNALLLFGEFVTLLFKKRRLV